MKSYNYIITREKDFAVTGGLQLHVLRVPVYIAVLWISVWMRYKRSVSASLVVADKCIDFFRLKLANLSVFGIIILEFFARGFVVGVV